MFVMFVMFVTFCAFCTGRVGGFCCIFCIVYVVIYVKEVLRIFTSALANFRKAFANFYKWSCEFSQDIREFSQGGLRILARHMQIFARHMRIFEDGRRGEGAAGGRGGGAAVWGHGRVDDHLAGRTCMWVAGAEGGPAPSRTFVLIIAGFGGAGGEGKVKSGAGALLTLRSVTCYEICRQVPLVDYNMGADRGPLVAIGTGK